MFEDIIQGFQGLLDVYLGLTSPILALVILSLTMFVLFLPMYCLSDYLVKKDTLRRLPMQCDLEKIRALTNSRERYYYTREVYKIYSYHPIHSLSSMFALALLVPLFLISYYGLHSYTGFDTTQSSTAFDLRAPDALLILIPNILRINILPFFMAGLSIISGLIYRYYENNFEESMVERRKSYSQIFIVPLIFLFVLYKEPSALLMFWSMNMLLSCMKNLILVINMYRKQARKKTKHTIVKDFQERILILSSLPTHVLNYILKCCRVALSHTRALGIHILVSALGIVSIALYLYIYPIDKNSALILSVLYSIALVCSYLLLLVKACINYVDNSSRTSIKIRTTKIKFYASLVLFVLFLVSLVFDYAGSITGSIADIFKNRLMSKSAEENSVLNSILQESYIITLAFCNALVILQLVLSYSRQEFKTFLDTLNSTFRKSILKKEYFVLALALCLSIAMQIFLVSFHYYLRSPRESLTTLLNISLELIVSMGLVFIILYSLFSLLIFVSKRVELFLAVLAFLTIISIFYAYFPMNSALIFNNFLANNPTHLQMPIRFKILEYLLLGVLLYYCIRVFCIKRSVLARAKKISFFIMLAFYFNFVSFVFLNLKDIRGILRQEKFNIRHAQLTLSKTQNIVVIFLDGFSNNLLADIFRDHNEFTEQLDGFVWYQNTASTGSFTWLGAPGILGGEAFTISGMIGTDMYSLDGNEIRNLAYSKMHNATDYFIDTVESYGADAIIYGKGHPLNLIRTAEHEKNIVDLVGNNAKGYYKYAYSTSLFKLAILKLLPLTHKYYFYTQEIDNKFPLSKFIVSRYIQMQKLKEYTFEKAKKDEKPQEKPRVSVFVSEMSHAPFYIDKDGKFGEKREGNYWDRDAQYDSDVFALQEIAKFIQRAKEDGIYDDMQIFLVSDHGNSGTEKTLVKDTRGILKKYAEEILWYDSILLVKEPRARGNLTIDTESFLANYDVHDMILHSLDASHKDPRERNSAGRNILYYANFESRDRKLITIVKMQGTALNTDSWDLLRQDNYNKRMGIHEETKPNAE